MSGYITRAPLRISFGGGGTDLPAYYERHGGLVVSAAITRYCFAVAGEPRNRAIRIRSADYHVRESFPHGMTPSVDGLLSLPKAAIEWFAPRGLTERGVDLFLSAEVPPGTGLGSSSAMAVALVYALAARCCMTLRPWEAAELASWIEIERLGMPIGKQDQNASAFGGVNLIEFQSDSVRVTPLRLSADVIAALSSRLMLFSTGRSRHSAAILGPQRTDTGTKSSVVESLHRIKALAAEMSEALLGEALDEFGCLLDRAWREKRQLSQKVSNADIDRWYGIAREAGALGGKITGAGGGGFLLLYCPPKRQAEVRTAMAKNGLRELTFDIDHVGAQVEARAGLQPSVVSHQHSAFSTQLRALNH